MSAKGPEKLFHTESVRPGAIATLTEIPGWNYALFGLLILVHLVPIWAFPLFPSQDGPIHLNIARTLMDLGDPALPVLGEYFTNALDWNRQPFAPLALMALFKVFPMMTAEKVFLSLIVILFPLSAAYASLALRRQTLGAAFFSFPFLYSSMMYGGSYTSFFSMAMFFVTVGYWLRIMGAYTPVRTAILVFLFLLTYLIHIFSSFQLLAFIGLGTAWRLVSEIRRPPVSEPMGTRLVRAFRREGLAPLIAALPVMTIILAWIGQEGTQAIEGGVQLERLAALLVMMPLISFSWHDLYFAAPIGTAMFSLIIWGGKATLSADVPGHAAGPMLFFIFTVYVLSFTFVPSHVGLSQTAHIRHSYYVYFALILWLLTLPTGPKVLRAHVVAVAVGAMVFVGYRLVQHERLNDYLVEYTSIFAHLPPNSTVLPLNVATIIDDEGRPLAGAINPFQSAGAAMSAQRGAAYLRHFPAGVDDNHALAYRPERNPYRYLSAEMDMMPPRGVSLTYPAGNGGRVDYVVLWGPLDAVANDAQVRHILDQLAADYTLISVSEKRGLARLYRRKGGAVR